MKPLTTIYKSKAKTIAMRNGDGFATNAIKGFTKDTRISGLTNGRFSLISLVRATLDITGPAHVLVSTWSAGFYDATAINDLLQYGKIESFRMILDRSFKTRQKQYSTYITDLFTPENIRTTDTHSKFVLIQNDEWNVCIRSSMNLNENKRCENFDMDNDIDVFNLFNGFANDVFEKMPVGIIEDRRIVDPIFNSLFSKIEMQNSDANNLIENDINYDII